jgi:glycosyltransferase involved in cell wall biosynthesis
MRFGEASEVVVPAYTGIGSAAARVETVHESSAWREQPVHVSGVLITYNHERFVELAVNSVLSQTYPLDIIVSDDHSTDRTPSLLRSALEGYEGRHRIRLRQGHRNLGICGNQNAGIQLAEGELIVLFEGDDESVPQRVAKLVDAYRDAHRRVAALGSAIWKMDAAGQRQTLVSWPHKTGDAWTALRGEWTVHGCGLSFRRDCFFEIGPISRRLFAGDIALWMRAAFLWEGGMLQVPEPLVRYRIHDHNASKGIYFNYSSPQALRDCWSDFLKGEVAQVLELKKIDRYRRRKGLQGDSLQAAWEAHFNLAQARARLTFAVSRKSRMSWIWPALMAFGFPPLRGKALRVIALALFPYAHAVYKSLRGRKPPRRSF